VVLIERGPWLGRGVAYGVDSTLPRLNVPASRMSIDPAVPDDFVRWAHSESAPETFLGRAQYGAYVVSRLAEAVKASPGKLRVLRGDVVALEGNSVRLADGRRVVAAQVVLATGLAPRVMLSDLQSDPRIVDAWDECGLATLPSGGRILVVGSGLSALDVVGLLASRGYEGQVVVLSRRGLLPGPHLSALPVARVTPVVVPERGSLRERLHWVRGLVRQAVSRGEPWQPVIDAMRPHLPRMWRSLSETDRRRFMRLLRPYWDAVQHRAPPDVLKLVERWGSQGALTLRAGQVVGCESDAQGLRVGIRSRSGRVEVERFDALVRGVGPALAQSEVDTPLVASLLEAGLAVPDPAGLGIVTDESGALVQLDGTASTRLVAVGGLCRASSWEATSVPEIARQARDHAQRLLGHQKP
jgi:uncharacterized NAD(P)/FAD-binding protein YdhS